MEKQVFQPIAALKAQLRDNNVKFRTFLCLAMSKGMLTGWLEALPKQKSEWEGLLRRGRSLIIT